MPKKQVQLLFVVLLTIAGAKYAFELVYLARYHGIGDFCGYYNCARVMKRGGNIYDEAEMQAAAEELGRSMTPGEQELLTYKPFYPPLVAYLFTPFTHLGFRTAARLWLGLSVLMWLACILLVRNLVGCRRDWVFTALLLVMAMSFDPMHNNYWHGQASVLTFMLICAFVVAFRAGYGPIGAVAFGISVVLKLTPVLFMGYYFLKRQYRTVVWCGVGLILASVLSVWVCGSEVNVHYFTKALPEVANSDLSTPGNQSPYGFLVRLARTLDMGERGLAASKLLSRVIALALLAVCALAMGRKPPADTRTLALEVSLVVMLLCLATPVTWPHHLVFIFLPLAAVLYQEWTRPDGWRAIPVLAYGLAIFLIAILNDFYVHAMFQTGPLVWVSSAKLYGVLILFVLTGLALRRPRSQTPNSEQAPE